MRQLHPSSVHEKFVASGIYTYYHNQQPAGIIEQWSIHELPDGAQLVRVDRDSMAQYGVTFLVEGLRSAQGNIERFDIHLYTSGAGSTKLAKASYIFVDGVVQIGRSINDGPRKYEEIILPADTVIYPQVRAFLGTVLLTAQSDSDVPIFLPWILDPDDELILSGWIDQRRSVALGEGRQTITGKSIAARSFHFLGGAYDENTIFWIDEYDMLVSYESVDGEWLATLTQYARRPEPKKL